MPIILGQGPNGSLVQHDDGSVGTLPAEIAAQYAQVPDLGTAAPGPIDNALIDPSGNIAPGPGAPPPEALPQAPAPPVGQTAPQNVLPQPGPTASPAVPPAPAPQGGPVPGPDLSQPPGQPATQPPGQGAAGELDPIVAEEAATVAAGEIAGQESDEKAAILEKRNLAVAAMQVSADELHAANLQRRAALDEKATAATQAYADHQINEPRPGWPQILGIVLGGIGQAMAKGDHNPALDQWEKMIAESVRKQENDRKRLGDVADRAGRELDRFVSWADSDESKFGARMAGEMDMAARYVETSAAKWGGPKAQANAKIASAQLRQKGQKHLEDATQREWENKQAAARDKLEAFKANEAVKARKAQIGLGYSQLKQGAKEHEQTRADAMFKWGAENVISASKDAADRADAQMKMAAAGNVAGLKASKDEEEDLNNLGVKSPTPTVKLDENNKPVFGKDGKPVLEYGYLKNPDGKPVKFAKGPGGEKAREKMAAAAVIAKLSDELVELVAENGWESDTVKGPAWTKIKSISQYLGPKLSAMTDQGVISKDDAKRFDFIQGGDPTVWLGNPIEGLRTMRNTVVRDATETLRQGSGYQGGELAIPENTRFGSLDAIQNTPQEESVRGATSGHLPAAAGPAALDTLMRDGTDRLRRDIAAGGGIQGFKGRTDRYPSASAEAQIIGLASGAKNGDTRSIEGLKLLYRDGNEIMKEAVSEIALKNDIDLGEGIVGPAEFEKVKRVARPIVGSSSAR